MKYYCCMARYFDTFIEQCNREQLVHFAICEFDVYELMELVTVKVKTEMAMQLQEGLIEKANANWAVFQTDIFNKILERIENVSDEKLIRALRNLNTSRQNAIMEDDYEWQLKG
jgi:hypothetical protein